MHRELPLWFSSDQNLAVVFALTPLMDIEELIHGILTQREHDVIIAPLSRSDCEELAEKIAALYTRAYEGFELSPEIWGSLKASITELLDRGEDSPRSIVRRCLSHLDSARIGSLRASS